MRNCRYLGESFTKAYGINYSIFVQSWARVAESAEIEAEKALIERARNNR